jgi:RNA polymerase sigma-70 factor (ECF subfamily)
MAVPSSEVRVPRRQTSTADRSAADRADDELSRTVAEAQQGNEDAFIQIYRSVQPGLLRYLTSLVGADAEDVASETWLQVCRDLATFSGSGDGFRGWVVTIGRHRALDSLRARGRRPADPYPVELLLAVSGPDDTAGAAVESLATARALKLITALPAEQAEAVLLRAVVGLDSATAGKVLGRRSGAVRMAAHRGLRSLAEHLIDPEPAAPSAGPVTANQPDTLNELM